MFRALSRRQLLLLRSSRAPILTRTHLFLPPTASTFSLQQQDRTFASSVKIHKSSNKKKKNKTKKQQQQTSPDAAKEREIQNLQQEVRFYHQQGSYDKALETSQLLLSTSETHFGKDHPATASAYNNVGLFYKMLGEYTQARQSYHQALRSYGLILGEHHESYAAALHNLGILHKTQVTLDENLSAMERLSLTEEAIEFLEQAHDIRSAELGHAHPHTVASQSALGSTIATQLLAQQQQQHQSSDGNSDCEYKPSSMTLERWQAAEQHLRQALETACQNPRGTRMDDDHNHDAAPQDIKTLSAAAAAQNLAVILKSRAALPDTFPNVDKEEMLEEAKRLYEQALVVREALLHEAHPDTVATKFSLAELVEVIGDTEGANQMRREIMDAYNITELDENGGDKEERNDGGGEKDGK